MKYEQTFDKQMGNPLEVIDNLIQQAHEMTKKKKTHTIIVHDEEDFDKTRIINF